MGATEVNFNVETIDLKAQSAIRNDQKKAETLAKMQAMANTLSGKVADFKCMHNFLMEENPSNSISTKDSLFSYALSKAGITSNQLSFYRNGDFDNPFWAFEAGI